jgi:glucokinase
MMNSAFMPDISAEMGFLVGVDIGGTKVAAGVVSATGEIKTQSRKPMIARGAASAGLAAVTSAIDALTEKPGNGAGTLRGIGICSPGPLDPATGIVINPPNLPCWRNFPLAAEVARIYRVPVRVDNDGNAAALAETLWGAGRGYKNVFYTCIGTGIGTGIVLDGRIYHGRTGAAAEGGHCSIDYRGPRCTCGKPGCIEVLASGPAIAKRARAKLILEPGPGSALLELAGGIPDAVTSDMVGRASAAGDRVAKETLKETIELLTLWLGNMIDLLDPEILIMGGGVSTMLQPLFGEIRDRLPSCCINSRTQEIPLVPACYGEDAGIAGGAALSSTT